MSGDRPLTVWQKVRLTFTRRRRGTGFWFGLAISLLWPPTLFAPRLTWKGGEHLPRTGGALLACNHVSFADPIYDVAFTVANGRVPRFLAKSELWGMPVVKWVLAGGGHVPVYRQTARAGDAFRGAVEALNRGEVVVFYPEGTYTGDPDHWPMKGKNGIGRIAMMSGAPVIPVANWGTHELLEPGTGKLRFWPRKSITVVAGPPIDLSAWLGGPRTRTALDGVTAAIMSEVTALVAEVRGETPPAVAFDPDARPEPPAAVDPVAEPERPTG